MEYIHDTDFKYNNVSRFFLKCLEKLLKTMYTQKPKHSVKMCLINLYLIDLQVIFSEMQ